MNHVDDHPIPTRRDVEIATFFWALRCEAVRDPARPFSKILWETYKDWPFVHRFTKGGYARVFREPICTFIRNFTSVDRKRAKLRIEIRKLMERAGDEQQIAFVLFLHEDQPYWEGVRFRGE